MNGPFAGIDPYIEAQTYWRDFHASFLTYLRDALNSMLPVHYKARIDERVCLTEDDLLERPRRAFFPDVTVVHRGPSALAEKSATAVVEADDPSETIPLEYAELERESWLKIIHRPDRSLVAVIELLSPTNKREGYGQYMIKRANLLHQPVHLIELDFLVAGRRMPLARPLPRGDYFALVARADRRPDCQVYGWSVRQTLPRILLPLKAPDPDLRLDLGTVFATAHERGQYTLDLDYTQDLTLPLAPEDRVWAEGLARAYASQAK